MHRRAKRRRCPSLGSLDLEVQQQSLFDLSLLKLQQEQRHGVEPRLLRFILINNALRALQSHMLQLSEEESSNGDALSEHFFCNTFVKGGALSSTLLTPPTPVKLPRLESAFSEQSPMVMASPSPSPSPFQDEEVGERGATLPEVEKRPSHSLAVVTQSCSSVRLDRSDPPPASWPKEGAVKKEADEKLCRPASLHINGTRLNGSSSVLYTVLEQLSPSSSLEEDLTTPSSSLEEDLTTPSPIDFTKVDPSLYDFDTRTNLVLPSAPPAPEGGCAGCSKAASCSMQAIVSTQNGDSDHCNSRLGGGVASSSPSPSPEGGETEFLDDLDHIVSLLMT